MTVSAVRLAPGTRVRCVNDVEGHGLVLGAEYIVRESFSVGQSVRVVTLEPSWFGRWYNATRFEQVTQ